MFAYNAIQYFWSIRAGCQQSQGETRTNDLDICAKLLLLLSQDEAAALACKPVLSTWAILSFTTWEIFAKSRKIISHIFHMSARHLSPPGLTFSSLTHFSFFPSCICPSGHHHFWHLLELHEFTSYYHALKFWDFWDEEEQVSHLLLPPTLLQIDLSFFLLIAMPKTDNFYHWKHLNSKCQDLTYSCENHNGLK